MEDQLSVSCKTAPWAASSKEGGGREHSSAQSGPLHMLLCSRVFVRSPRLEPLEAAHRERGSEA